MSILEAKLSKPLEGGPSYGVSNRVFRAAWKLTWLVLASWTPPMMHRWRVLVLNSFGARVHSSAHVYASVDVWYPPNLIVEKNACLGPGVTCYNMAPIRLCHEAVVSQRAHLCAGMHDIDDPNFQLLAREIEIGAGAWVAAEAFVGPGVKVGEHAVIGARAVIFGDAEASGVYVGNPARLLRQRSRGKQENE